MKITITDIPRKPGTTFSAQFRVTGIRNHTDRFGRPYQKMRLVDITGQIPSFRWKIKGGWSLEELEAVQVEGRIRQFNGKWIVDILEISPLWADFEDPADALQLLPWSHCPKRDALPRLQAIADAVHTPAMRDFLNSVLADMDIACGLISATASWNHHHHWAGGLLEHSIECADWILKLESNPSWRRDIALIGALLHDIGKTQTCKLVANGAPDAYLINHDARTLEILAPHLRKLEQHWQDGAAALRYVWTWQQGFRRPQYPALIEAEIVRFVDRLSAIGDIQDLAFSGIEEWKRFSRFGDRDENGRPRGPTQQCWRPRPPRGTEPD